MGNMKDDSLENKIGSFSIDLLDLSVRSFNGLKRNNIMTIDKLLNMKEDELYKIRNLGVKSVKEIISKVDSWKYTFENDFLYDEIVQGKAQEFYGELAALFSKIINVNAKEIYKICKDIKIFDGGDVTCIDELEVVDFYWLIDKTILSKYFINHIEKNLKQNGGYIKNEEIYVLVNNAFENEILREAALSYIKNNHLLFALGDYLIVKRPCLHECIEFLDESDKKHMLIERLEGKTLQEIGDEFGVTRERVRQIVSKTIKRFPLTYEDYYSDLFTSYKIDKNDFYQIFQNEHKYTYNFLCLKYNKGKKIIDSESVMMYKGIFKPQLEEFASAENEKTTKYSIVWKVLTSAEKEYMSFDEFVRVYNNYILKHNLNKSNHIKNFRSLMNRMRSSKRIVFNEFGDFRAYNYDASRLWRTIKYNSYNNKVISTEKIFNDYIDLMDDLDIRDGYELFCLLKNTCVNNKGGTKIKFRRIPMIVIGSADEKKQTIDLLREVSPISYSEYFKLYEERYGVRVKTAQANLGKYLVSYYSNGGYEIDLPRMSEDVVLKLKSFIDRKNFWTLYELENIFSKDKNCDMDGMLNRPNLRRLGYIFNSKYAYNEKYDNASLALKDMVFSQTIVDVNELDSQLVNLQPFQQLLLCFRESMEYVEIGQKLFAKMQYLERKCGLTYDLVIEIQKHVFQHNNDKYFNGNSLWYIVEENGFNIKLDENPWVLTSILRQKENVYSLRVSGNIILSFDKDDLNIAKICEWLIEKDGNMSLTMLTERLNDMFGVSMDKYKIAEKVKSFFGEDGLLRTEVDEYVASLSDGLDEEALDDIFQEEFF